MKVLLVSINRVRYPYPVYPLGLNHVAAGLAPRHRVRIADLCQDGPDSEALVDAIRDFAPDAVGVSVRNVDSTDFTSPRGFAGDARDVVSAIRRITSATVVLGGAGYALFPREILLRTGADWGFLGEGEASAPLFDALEAGRSPAGLPGVVGREGQLPEPARAADPANPVDPELNPALGWYLAHGGVLNLQTQRGCPFRCTYCTYPAIEGSRSRWFDPPGVAMRARTLERAGARHLTLTDSAFNVRPSHCLAIGDAFREAGLGIPWGAFFAPTAPLPGFYERLVSAGLSHVEFGTESLSDPMLPRIGKSFRRDDVLAAHRAARAAGANVAHFLLFGGPGETEETMEETIRATDELEGAALFVFCGMRIYPATGLWRTAIAEGQIEADDPLLDPKYYRPTGIPLEAIVDRVRDHAATRGNWVVGDGAREVERKVEFLHERGHSGPLWEWLTLG